MIFLSFFLICNHSNQVWGQRANRFAAYKLHLEMRKKPAKYLYGSKRNSIPFCRFDKRFQGVATISAPK